MAKQCKLINPLDPGSSATLCQIIQWNRCALCQKETEEALICPVDSERGDGAGYKTLAGYSCNQGWGVGRKFTTPTPTPTPKIFKATTPTPTPTPKIFKATTPTPALPKKSRLRLTTTPQP